MCKEVSYKNKYMLNSFYITRHVVKFNTLVLMYTTEEIDLYIYQENINV